MTNTQTSTVIELSVNLTDAEIAQRVSEVKDYDRFSVLTAAIQSEEHALRVANVDHVLVTSKDGSIYFGYVEDWDGSHYYVNLR